MSFERQVNASTFLARSQRIEASDLSQQEKFSKEILEEQLQVFIDGYQFRRCRSAFS